MRIPTFVKGTPRRRLYAFMAFGVLVTVGSAWALFSRERGPERIVVQQLDPLPETSRLAATTPKPAPPPAVAEEAPQPPPEAAAPVVAELQPEDFTPAMTAAPELDSSTPLRRKARASSQPSAASTKSRIGRDAPARPTYSQDMPEPSPVLVTTPVPVATQRPVEEGSDLGIGRRSNSVRIDRENPYR